MMYQLTPMYAIGQTDITMYRVNAMYAGLWYGTDHTIIQSPRDGLWYGYTNDTRVTAGHTVDSLALIALLTGE